MATGDHLPMEWQSVIHWLLQASEPWVVYNTLRDLVTLDVSSPNIQQAYQGMQQHPAVLDLFHTLQQWPAVSPLGRAYDPKVCYHKPCRQLASPKWNAQSARRRVL